MKNTDSLRTHSAQFRIVFQFDFESLFRAMFSTSRGHQISDRHGRGRPWRVQGTCNPWLMAWCYTVRKNSRTAVYLIFPSE